VADNSEVAAFSGGALLGGTLGTLISKDRVQVTFPPELAEAIANLNATALQLQDTISRFSEAVSRLEAVADVLSRQATQEIAKVSMPIDFRNLGRLIQSFGVPGETEFLLYSQTVLVPAGTETTFVVLIPENFVGAFIEPVYIMSDYYSSSITGKVTVDDTRVVTPIPYYFTAPARLSLGEWYVARRNLTITVNNGTGVDATMTAQAQVVLMQVSFYEEWYRPVLKASWEMVNDLVELYGGKRR